jgi:hypothetical protein
LVVPVNVKSERSITIKITITLREPCEHTIIWNYMEFHMEFHMEMMEFCACNLGDK